MVVSQNKGPQYRLQNTIVLIMGTTQKGNPHFGKPLYASAGVSIVLLSGPESQRRCHPPFLCPKVLRTCPIIKSRLRGPIGVYIGMYRV